MHFNSIDKNKKTDKVTIAMISTIFVLVVFGVIILSIMMNNQIKSSEKLVQEVSQQLAFNVHNRIAGDLQVLEMLSNTLNLKTFSQKDLLPLLKSGGRQAVFKEFSLITLDGIAYGANRETGILPKHNMAKHPCFIKSKAGKTCFDRTQESKEGWGTYRNIYTVPVYENNKIVAVLAATVRADVFKNILDINNFDSKGFSHITKNDGNYILRSGHPSVENFPNIFNQKTIYLGLSEQYIKNQFKNLKNGIFWSFRDGQLWLAAYTPVSYEDWLITLYVPGSVLAMSALEIMLLTIAIMLAINCLLFMILKRFESLQNQSYKSMIDLAFGDDITNGPNKAKFILEAKYLLDGISDSSKYALVLMDITKFKVINELYGFEKANIILKNMYDIIKSKLPEKTLMTRSFAATYLFLLKYESEYYINSIVDDIYKEIENYNQTIMTNLNDMNNKSVAKLVPLFGVYLINDTSIPINIMCDRVSLAKRTIVDDVNKYISYYDDNLRKQLLSEKTIEDEMHSALAKGQFVMYLQPKYDMKTLTVAGSEALVRWIHPTRGFMPPNDFIPLFEKNGFVLNLDRYMWEEACKVLRRWIDTGYRPIPISVNVSRLHLNSEFFIEDLIKLIEKYTIPPSLIELELTETAGFEDFDKFLDVLHELKKYGFSIAMDDFGAGYSSLNMLRQIPCDILKLDRGFINDSTTDERGKIVVQHVLSMAKNLSLKTVSEGIETIDQAKFLTDAGCDIAQGFLYAKPMSVADFEKIAFLQKKLVIDGLTN